MNLELKVDETHAPVTVVSLTGELDLESAPVLREAALDLLRQGHHRLVIDLSAVVFIDSIGLGVLMLVLKRLEAVDGELSLVCKQGEAMRVFEVSGLTSVFKLFGSLDEATGRAA